MWVDIFSEEDEEVLKGKTKLFMSPLLLLDNNDNDSDNDNDGENDSDNQVHTFGQLQSRKKGFGKVVQLYSTSF